MKLTLTSVQYFSNETTLASPDLDEIKPTHNGVGVQWQAIYCRVPLSAVVMSQRQLLSGLQQKIIPILLAFRVFPGLVAQGIW